MHQVTKSFTSLNACQASRLAAHSSARIQEEVLRTWDFLENLFIHSEEVKKDRLPLPEFLEGWGSWVKRWRMSRDVIIIQELPDESERFLEIDDDVKQLLRRGFEAWLRLRRCYEVMCTPQCLRSCQARFAKVFCADPSIYQASRAAEPVCMSMRCSFLSPCRSWRRRRLSSPCARRPSEKNLSELHREFRPSYKIAFNSQ